MTLVVAVPWGALALFVSIAAFSLLAIALTTARGRRIVIPQADRSSDLVRGVVFFVAIATTAARVAPRSATW